MVENLALRLQNMLAEAGVGTPEIPPTVRIGRRDDKSTWRTHDPSLQVAAQPIIDAFDPNDPAHVTAELDEQVKIMFDKERIFSSLVWAIISTFDAPVDAPATKRKYNIVRERAIEAFKEKPWE